jgi:hypothetical protein
VRGPQPIKISAAREKCPKIGVIARRARGQLLHSKRVVVYTRGQKAAGRIDAPGAFVLPHLAS